MGGLCTTPPPPEIGNWELGRCRTWEELEPPRRTAGLQRRHSRPRPDTPVPGRCRDESLQPLDAALGFRASLRRGPLHWAPAVCSPWDRTSWTACNRAPPPARSPGWGGAEASSPLRAPPPRRSPSSETPQVGAFPSGAPCPGPWPRESRGSACPAWGLPARHPPPWAPYLPWWVPQLLSLGSHSPPSGCSPALLGFCLGGPHAQ